MQKISGFCLPDRETRVEEVLKDSIRLNRPAYQHHKFEAAVALCKQRRLALDIGAHIGMWTLQMAAAGFEHVAAFDPDPEKTLCFEANLARWLPQGSTTAITHFDFGLSDKAGRISLIHKAGTSLKTHVRLDAQGELRVETLDEVAVSQLPDLPIDFIKIDVEGFEDFVVQGGQQTIRRYMPVIVVEQKKEVATKRYGISDRAAVTRLQLWGYDIAAEFNGDYVMVPHAV